MVIILRDYKDTDHFPSVSDFYEEVYCTQNSTHNNMSLYTKWDTGDTDSLHEINTLQLRWNKYKNVLNTCALTNATGQALNSTILPHRNVIFREKCNTYTYIYLYKTLYSDHYFANVAVYKTSLFFQTSQISCTDT